MAGSQRRIGRWCNAQTFHTFHGKPLHQGMVGLCAAFHASQHGPRHAKKTHQEKNQNASASWPCPAVAAEQRNAGDNDGRRNEDDYVLPESHADTDHQTQQRQQEAKPGQNRFCLHEIHKQEYGSQGKRGLAEVAQLGQHNQYGRGQHKYKCEHRTDDPSHTQTEKPIRCRRAPAQHQRH